MSAAVRRPLLFALFTVSGFAGLVYESLWSHYLKLFLGHAAYAQTFVLALFMGGMAAGAWLASRRAARARNLLRGYAVVEAVIGVAAFAFHPLFVAATQSAHASWLPALASEPLAALLKGSLAAALVLPQSVLLGATFPLMSGGLLRRHPERPGEALALLYFTNSLGAAIGVLASGFVLIERLGLPGAMQFAGAVNVALAVVVWLLAPGRDPSTEPAERAAPIARGAAPLGWLLAVAALTGTASFVYEIVWIRMLALVLGASTHSFELMLAAFILGLALGGLWIRRRIDRLGRPLVFLAGVQIVMGLAALVTIPLYDVTFALMQQLVRGLAKTDAGYSLFLASSHGIALAIMLPATFCAGTTLPLITYSLLRAGAGERAIGQVYAANTLGAIVGVVLAAHVLLPVLGVKGALIAGAALDALLGIALLTAADRRARRSVGRRARVPLATTAVVAASFGTIGFGTALDPLRMASGVYRRGDLYTARDAKLEFYRDGKTTSVALVQFEEGLSLRTNGKSDGAINLDPAGERISDEVTMVLTAALPLAVHPAARSAAVIGIGTGLTTHTLLAAESLERVDTIEIEPAMAEAARRFAPRNTNAYADPRSNIVFDDAKTYFSTHNRRYDVIVSEPSNPWVSGVASLFTAEFYRHVRRYLAPGGILVQWFQLYEIDASLVASVLTALGEAFPDYAIYAATDSDLLIVAGDPATLARPLADVFAMPGVAAELRRVHVQAIGDLELRRVGRKSLLAPYFAAYGVPANSDYYPYLDTHAARYRFLQSSARELTSLGAEGVPVAALLAPEPRRAPSLAGETFFERIEVARRAAYAHAFLTAAEPPEPRAIPTSFQKDLELSRLRAIDCRDPQKYDIWLASTLQVARTVNVGLERDAADALWQRYERAPCYAQLDEVDRRWVALHAAIGRRELAAIDAHAHRLLADDARLTPSSRQYLLTAALAATIAAGDLDRAVAVWNAEIDRVPRGSLDPNLRLLHAQLAAAGRTRSARP